MSHETLSPVPLNLDTTEQHDVVHGEVVEPATDEHGFMESALRSQNGETHPESRKPRHKREVVESIDPENIKLYGVTATLAQMQSARELVHSEEFLAHTSEEQEYLIENILERMLIEDDPLHDSYASKKHHLRAMLLESDEKFKKTARRKELDQARRDGVKLKRASEPEEDTGEKTPLISKLKALVEREQSEHKDTNLTETQPSAPKLRREIKKLDREYLGIVGKIAETGTKPEYLDAKYADFKAMTGPENYEINDRNRRGAEREAIRKLVQRAVDAKNLEGAERQAYEDHLVSVFHDYVSLSDADREGLHESLDARYAKARELRAVQANAEKPVEDEARETTDSRKKSVKSVLGAMALKIAQHSRRVRSDNTPRGEEDGQLALFSDEPYNKTHNEKNRLKRSAELFHDGTAAIISRYQARRVHKNNLEQTRLAALSDEERALERKKKGGKISMKPAIGAAAVLGVALLAAKFGPEIIDSIAGDRGPASSDGIRAGGLADLLNLPADGSSAQEVVPGVELDTRGGGDSNSYSQSAFRVDNGEGLFQTFQDMGIPQDKWHDVLRETGPKLVRMGEAYSDPSLGGYGLNGDGKLSYRALDVISEAAKNTK